VVDLLMTHVTRTHATLILVTHDEELACRVADRILRMHDGKVSE
jgi:predicted ABC-type transport system involved in lysophospholipase L1 biosynthesis ATPase subunit